MFVLRLGGESYCGVAGGTFYDTEMVKKNRDIPFAVTSRWLLNHSLGYITKFSHPSVWLTELKDGYFMSS
jgi:hypothetical protein